MSILTYLLAALAALANATSSTLQRKANADEPDSASFTPKLIVDLLHRPVWLGGILAVIAGFVLQAAALNSGDLAVVEPVLALELPLTLGLGSILFRRRLRAREWTSAALLAGGVGLLLVSLRPHGGSVNGVALWEWAVALAAFLGAIGALIGWGRRSKGAQRAALLGVATGAAFGVTAALMTPMSEAASTSFFSILTVWQTYAMIATGGAAMYLLQNALQAGTLVSVQPGLTLTDPLVSIVWGIVVFGERVQGGLWYLAAFLGGAAIILGTVRLSHSPLLAGNDGAGDGGAEVSTDAEAPTD